MPFITISDFQIEYIDKLLVVLCRQHQSIYPNTFILYKIAIDFSSDTSCQNSHVALEFTQHNSLQVHS